jgi:hypothetical protein
MTQFGTLFEIRVSGFHETHMELPMTKLLPALCILLLTAPHVKASEKPRNLHEMGGDDEPDIGDVQKAAERHAGFDLAKTASWKKRAANSAWLPEVNVRVKKESFANDGEKYNTESPYQTFTAGEGLFFEVGVRWSLDALVFDRRELEASREGAAVFGEYKKLMEEVSRIYFERKLLLAETSGGYPAKDILVEKQIRIQELTAMLDALSGGQFSREVARKHRNTEEAK